MDDYFIKTVLNDERLTCEGKLDILRQKIEGKLEPVD